MKRDEGTKTESALKCDFKTFLGEAAERNFHDLSNIKGKRLIFSVHCSHLVVVMVCQYNFLMLNMKVDQKTSLRLQGFI